MLTRDHIHLFLRNWRISFWKSPIHIVLVLLSSVCTTLAAEVSRTAPAVYETTIAPLLQPIEDVLATKTPDHGKDDPGTVILVETITHVEKDGTYVRAVRYVYEPRTQKGAEQVATDRFRFHSRLEKIHLLRARTILPDGSEKLPGPNAVFTQKATKSSGSAYDDSVDLVVVFPDVKPGVICEVVVVYERTTPSVAEGHGELMFWTAGWPIVSKRYVVDMPSSWKKKLAIHKLGSTPKMASLPSPDGRIRREWVSGLIASAASESNMAPELQTGPFTWLTTFTDWDEVASWYADLLGERVELGDELEALVDEWTAKATKPDEVLEILYDKVANDIRYEALGFGISGLQPYPCATVWENQYGDCKDKSNLLAAMLRHKGIEARLSLVNTRHAGLIHRKIPDFRHFDHAIVAVKLPTVDGEKKVVFCDPTIRHGRPGMLAASSAERDVLVVGEAKAEWLRTPTADAGTDHYVFDVELDEAGRLSGWLTIKSSGYYAISLARSLAGLDRDTARSHLQDRVSGFIAGAEVVDFLVPELGRTIDECEAKVYFICPPRPTDDEQRISLPMPSSDVLYNNFGDGKDRKTSFHMWPDRVRVDANVRLPEGWAAVTLPAPLKMETPHYEVSAKWAAADLGYVGSLDVRCLAPLIPPNQVAAAARVNRTLFSWLEIPLLLKKGADTVVEIKAEPVRMPIMPTGEGQLELVNRLYPRNGNTERRGTALRQVLRDFPDEPTTIFDTKVEIAYLCYIDEDYETAERGFAKLEPAAAGVRPESIAFARYLRALSLQQLKRTDEAIGIMRVLAADKSISTFRRGWAATTAGGWLITGADVVPEEAFALLEQAIGMRDDSLDTALDLLIPALGKADRGERLVELLANAEIFDLSSDEGEFAIQSLANADAKKAMVWLEDAIERSSAPTHKVRLKKELGKLSAAKELTKQMEKLRLSLVDWLRLERPDDFLGEAIPENEKAAATEKRLNDLAHKDRAEWRRLMARYFEGFTAAPGFSHQLWLYLEHIANLPTGDAGNETYFEAVMKIADDMPPKDPNHWEIQFVKASWLTARGRLAETETLYKEMREHPEFDTDFEFSAGHRLGAALEQQGKWDEAIENYVEFAAQRVDYKTVAPHLLRAGVLMALSGREEEALKTWKLLTDVPKKQYADSGYQDEIAEAISLAENPEETLAQWKVTEEWWKKSFMPWHASLGIGAPGIYPAYLSIDADELDVRCGSARDNGEIRIVATELVRVAATARILPKYVEYLRQMQLIYLSPLRPKAAKAMNISLSEIAAAHRVGRKDSVDLCRRLAAALKVDLGDASYALENLDGDWLPDSEGSAEHRERSGMLFCFAARLSGDRLDDAISCAAHFLDQGPAFFPRSQWLALQADLLVTAERPADAVALLKAALEEDAITDQASELAAVKSKLTELQAQIDADRDIGPVVAAFLEKYKPVWYDQVGPEDLTDPRLVKPETLLQDEVSGFHDTELFRARMLLSISAEINREVRSEAFLLAALQAGLWQRDAPEAVKLWKYLIDNASLPTETRLQLLWQAALNVSAKGQTEELAALMDCDVFDGFRKDYPSSYFPILKVQAEILGSTTEKEDAASVKRITHMELDQIGLNLAARIHASLLVKGNESEAKAMRDVLKNWKMTPQAEPIRSATRLEWARLARRAASSLVLHRIMLEPVEVTLRAKAAEAPELWITRMDVHGMYDLPSGKRQGIMASRLLTGIRHDKTDLLLWASSSDDWFSDGEKETSHETVLKAIDGLREVRDDRSLWLILLGLLEATQKWEDWSELDKRLIFFRNAEKFPATHGLIRLWENNRNFHPDNATDITSHLGWISQQPYKPPFYAGLLEMLLLKRDKAGLERVLDEVETEQLTSDTALSAYFEALTLLERSEELEILEPTMEKAIQELMLEAWLMGSPFHFDNACDLAMRYSQKKMLTDTFLEKVPQMMGDPHEKRISLARVYMLRKEWKKAVNTLREIDDTVYLDSADFNYLMGVSLYKLGDIEKFKKYLEAACNSSSPGEMTHYHARNLLNPEK